ncbi:phosphomethylpyrimidine synthase ThiC [Nostocoides australiense]
MTLAERSGVTTVTDLTTSRDDRLLQSLLSESELAVGTVPAYSLSSAAAGGSKETAARTLYSAIERQVLLGVDFLSIHSSLSRRVAERLSAARRTIPVTSRGGALVLQVMHNAAVDNPFRTVFEDLLALCASHGVVLSFVGTLRPGSVVDSFETLHLEELQETAELTERAHEAGVATMVELLNHVPLSSIEAYVKLGRSLFPHSALGALGPTPTDIAVGLDDVAGAIGAATAARAGIDWINVVTAGEHSHLPSYEETARALRYFQLAAHLSAVSEGHDSRDRALSAARACNDWSTMANMSIDPQLARQVYAEHGNRQGAACSMCKATCPLVRYRRISVHADDHRATTIVSPPIVRPAKT